MNPSAIVSKGKIAINATLYGSTKISYILAKVGEIPHLLKRKMWTKPVEGLVITSGIALIISNLFDLSRIAMMGSSGFLIIFAAVNWSNFKLYKETQSKRVISLVGTIVCVSALMVLLHNSISMSISDIWFLVLIISCSFGMEYFYHKITKRKIQKHF